MLSTIPWQIFAIFSIVFSSFGDISNQRLLTRKNLSIQASVWIGEFVYLSIGLILVFVTGSSLMYNLESVIIPIIIGAIIKTGYIYAFTRALKGKSIGISSIILSYSVVISAVGGIVILGEGLSNEQIIGIVFILTSIGILLFQKLHLEQQHLWAFGAIILFGIGAVIDDYILRGYSPGGLMFMQATIIFGIYSLVKPYKLVSEVKRIRPYLWSFLGMKVAYNLFWISNFYAYQNGGQIGLVDAANNASFVIIIIWEYAALQERSHIIKKIICSILAILGSLIILT